MPGTAFELSSCAFPKAGPFPPRLASGASFSSFPVIASQAGLFFSGLEGNGGLSLRPRRLFFLSTVARSPFRQKKPSQPRPGFSLRLQVSPPTTPPHKSALFPRSFRLQLYPPPPSAGPSLPSPPLPTSIGGSFFQAFSRSALSLLHWTRTALFAGRPLALGPGQPFRREKKY